LNPGKFAEFGNTVDDAMENAQRWISKTAMNNGEATICIRRPNFFEVIFG
jgi:hypothetical protein